MDSLRLIHTMNNKKATLSFVTSDEKLWTDSPLTRVPSKSYSEREPLTIFRENIQHLREEVNRLSFMISEIRSVLESSSTESRFLA